jgi:hypothetical protein
MTHLGKAEHPLDNPDRMFDPGPHLGFGAVFGPLDLIDNTAVAARLFAGEGAKVVIGDVLEREGRQPWRAAAPRFR